MVKLSKLLGVFVLILAAGMLLSSCEVAKYTGGGTIPGADGGKANFGFNINTCKDPMTSNVLYRDKNSEVALMGWVMDAEDCKHGGWMCDLCRDIGRSRFHCGDRAKFKAAAKIGYTSKNPRVPDDYDNPEKQKAVLCISDKGEGANAKKPDVVAIKILSGPFAPYINCGRVKGNIQKHECPDDELEF